jgi:hypothetical protein
VIKVEKAVMERAARASIDMTAMQAGIAEAKEEDEDTAPTYIGPDALKGGLIYHIQVRACVVAAGDVCVYVRACVCVCVCVN